MSRWYTAEDIEQEVLPRFLAEASAETLLTEVIWYATTARYTPSKHLKRACLDMASLLLAQAIRKVEA